MEQFGTTKLGKPHMCSFKPNWLEEFKTDGLIYSVIEDGAYCKYCKLFPGGERGLLVEWHEQFSFVKYCISGHPIL